MTPEEFPKIARVFPRRIPSTTPITAMTPGEFPPEGFTYREFQRSYGLSKAVAIKEFNEIIVSLHLVSSETRGEYRSRIWKSGEGVTVFRMEPDEVFPGSESMSGKKTWFQSVGHGFRHRVFFPKPCAYRECGKQFMPKNDRQLFCDNLCAKREQNERAMIIACEKIGEIPCIWCKKKFLPKKTTQKACCMQCSASARQQERKMGEYNEMP